MTQIEINSLKPGDIIRYLDNGLRIIGIVIDVDKLKDNPFSRRIKAFIMYAEVMDKVTMSMYHNKIHHYDVNSLMYGNHYTNTNYGWKQIKTNSSHDN